MALDEPSRSRRPKAERDLSSSRRWNSPSEHEIIKDLSSGRSGVRDAAASARKLQSGEVRRLGSAAEGCKVTPTIVDYLYAIAPRSASPAQASFGSPLPVRVLRCIAGPSSFAGNYLGWAVCTKGARTRRRARTRGGATRHRRS